jgi:BirA family biotin operon repressor/biotin-[acetyl-CoA-carboxylase] ligase
MINARVPKWRLDWYVTLDSTQLEAQRLAGHGAPDRTVILAEEQTAGMGRLGRTWLSEPGKGLYLSTILRMPVTAAQLPVFTLALGLAAKQAIEQTGEIACDLRWPNDVLCGGRKLCGILCQIHDGAVIAGIGINVDHDEFPAELVPIATSMRREGANLVSREDLLVALLDSIDEYVTLFLADGKEPILRLFSAASSYVWQRRVAVDHERGVTRGLDPDGFLILQRDDGTRVTIVAGGVRPE